MDADPAAPAVLARLGGRIGAFHVQHHPVHRPFRVEQVLRRAHLYVAAGGADSTASCSTRVASWSMLRTRRSRSGPAPPSAMKRAVAGAGAARHPRAHTPPPAAGPRSRRVPAARGGPASRPGAGPDHGRAAGRRLALPGGSAPLRCPPRPAAPAPRPGARAAPASRVAIRDRSRRRRTAAPVAASAPGFARRWRPAKACPARKRPHGPAARALGRRGRGQSRRFRRMQRPLLARLQQAAAAHRHGPGREGTQHDQDQQQRAPARAPAAADSRAALPPCADLGPQGRAMNHTISTRKERCPGP